MSFRQNNEKSSAWSDWLRKNEADLNKCGLHEIVVKSEEHWWDFLMHGYLDHHHDPSNFMVEELSKTQMSYLKQFLESTLLPDEKRSAIVLLQLESKLSSL